jgi:hypothetical protein
MGGINHLAKGKKKVKGCSHGLGKSNGMKEGVC